MKRYDVAIIGTGPAGLEAALTLKNRNKEFLLFGSKNSSEKVSKAHEIKNYLGLPNVKGNDFSKAFMDHIEVMGINVTEDKISQVYGMGGYYMLQGSKEQYEATTVILACGMTMAKPIEGEEEYLGRGVSYCATCDAPLYKGKNVGVVLENINDFEEVEFLSTVVDHLYLFKAFKEETPKLPANVELIDEKVTSFTGAMKFNTVNTVSNSYQMDGVFVLRESVSAGYLVPGLKMDGVHVDVNRQLETNLKGLFACGDITGKPYQYIKAAGEGNVAALSAVSYLANNKEAK